MDINDSDTMEDIIRYGVILIGILYFLYRLKRFLIDKKYGCETCAYKDTCNRKTCSIYELSEEEKKKIKDIKEDFNKF